MEVAHRDGEIVFLRKLREGPAAESYGLHVASLAGLPERVIRRSEEIMASFSNEKHFPKGKHFSDGKLSAPTAVTEKPSQNVNETRVIKELSELEINRLTPLEALNIIQHWKQTLTGRQKTKSSAKSTDTEPFLFDQ